MNPQDATFRFEAGDLNFLAEVARRLAPLAERPDLAPEEAAVIARAVGALQKLPDPTPGINVRIEVAHRMGDEAFRESYSYVVKLDESRIQVTSSGVQSHAEAGSESFGLESLEWHAGGHATFAGNRDTWLERLSYALDRNFTLTTTDESE